MAAECSPPHISSLSRLLNGTKYVAESRYTFCCPLLPKGLRPGRIRAGRRQSRKREAWLLAGERTQEGRDVTAVLLAQFAAQLNARHDLDRLLQAVHRAIM